MRRLLGCILLMGNVLIPSGGDVQFSNDGLSSAAGLQLNHIGLTSPAEEVTYRAAVVEYDCPSWGTSEAGNHTATEFMMANVDNYRRMAQQASELDVDILVFPEYGLTSLNLPVDRKKARPFFQKVADPADTVAPCDEDENDPDQVIIKSLSCVARESGLYVVVDLAEVAPCDVLSDSKCPDDGHYFFNTAVAFDRDGIIVARYRKIHLYLESQMNYPPVPAAASFVTDFGVEFGLFVCFDIMFEHPMIDLHKRGIRDFVFPTAWVDAYPMFLAHQVQSFTAIGLNSNLLASGYHNPPTASVGSGIYSVSTNSTGLAYSMQKISRMVVSDVVSPPRPDFNALPSHVIIPPLDIDIVEEPHYLLPTDFSEFNFTRLEHSKGHAKDATACDETLCCQLSYSTTTVDSRTEPTFSYALGAFSGRVFIQNQYSWKAQACVVVLCSTNQGDAQENCGQLPNMVTEMIDGVTHFHKDKNATEVAAKDIPTFNSLVLTGNFDTSFIYPSGIDLGFQLLVSSKLRFSSEEGKRGTRMKAQLDAVAPLNNLAYAGIYARLYSED